MFLNIHIQGTSNLNIRIQGINTLEQFIKRKEIAIANHVLSNIALIIVVE